MLLLAIPGMVGEVVVLSHFATLMPPAGRCRRTMRSFSFRDVRPGGGGDAAPDGMGCAT